MRNNTKNILAALLITAMSFSSLLLASSSSVFALSANQEEVCKAIGDGSCDGTNNGGIDVNSVIANGVNIFTGIVGIVAVIMIVVAGFKYITAAGDSNKVASAKNTLVFAIIGLIIVALAQVIVRFVLNKVT